MKVLHVLNEISHSGAELMLHSSCPYFRDKGVGFTALATGKGKGSFSDQFEEVGIPVVHKPLVKGITLPLMFFPYFLKYVSYLRKQQFDVVHIHRMYLYFWFALFAKVAGIKVTIRTVHNVFTPTYRYPQYYLSRKILRWLGVEFTSIGKSVEDHEKNFFKNKTVRINNWFDPNNFWPLEKDKSKEEIRKSFNVPADSTVLISVGSCLPQKNHNHIIEAIAKLCSKYPKLFYLHLGDGVLCQEEQELVESRGLVDNTVFVGNVNNVRDYLVMSDIFLMPSDFEGLGISFLESMACGIPSIGYNVPGIRDLIVHNENGLLIPKSIEGLAESIEYLINNEDKRAGFARKSIEMVQSEYSIEKSVEKFVELYQSVK